MGDGVTGRGGWAESDMVIVRDVPQIGLVTIPFRWLGRKSRVTGEPAVALHALSKATGVHVCALGLIFSGRERPYQRTVDALARVGIIIPKAYTQRERTFRRLDHRCKECRRAFTSSREVARFCTHACAMRSWHRRQVADRLCNYCGKPADGCYAFTCKAHEAIKRRAHTRNYETKVRRFKEDGLCKTCGVVPARERRITCVLCAVRGTNYRIRQQRRVREDRRARGLVTTLEASNLLGFNRYQSVHHLIARGRLTVAETSGATRKRFYLNVDEVERYRSWRDGKRHAPFVPVADPNALLASIRHQLPEGLPDDVADDAVGAIMLDVLENKIALAQLDAPTLRAYIGQAYKWRGDMYQRSLDAPISEDGGTLAELIGEDETGYEEVLEQMA